MLHATQKNEYQVHQDGPLTQETVTFILSFKDHHHLTYKNLGDIFGISEAFAYNILKKSGNLTTRSSGKKIEAGLGRMHQGNVTRSGRDDSSSETTLNYHFSLRKGMTISFSLPKDFTLKEAERLCNYIRLLPPPHQEASVASQP